MPGKITYNSIDIDFKNEWVKFDDSLILKSTQLRSASGIVETLKFFEQQFISTQLRNAPGQDEIQLRRFFEYANDGSTFSLTRDRNLGTYISFEGKSLNTNDETAGTLTRAHTSPTNDDTVWYLEPSTGFMTVVDAANTATFPEGKYGRGISIRGAATNLITHPSAFDNAAWVKTDVTASANTTETLDPAGANNADKLTTTAPGGTVTFTTTTAVGNNVSEGAWFKCQSGTVSASLTITGSGSGSSGAQAITISPEWQVFSISADTSAFTGNLVYTLTIDTNSTSIYAWGAGMFDSFEFYPGTIGALSTSSKTRIAERGVELSSTDIINKDKGTISGWFIPDFEFAENPAILLFSCADDSLTATRHSQLEISAAGALRAVFRKNNDGTSAVDFNQTLSGIITAGQAHHFGMTWDTTISNGVKIYWDGVLINTSSNDPFNVSDVGSTISIGGLVSSNGFPANGVIDDVIITKDVKPASWFNQIFSRSTALGEGRNYWPSVRLSDLNYARQALRGNRSTIPLDFEEVLT